MAWWPLQKGEDEGDRPEGDDGIRLEFEFMGIIDAGPSSILECLGLPEVELPAPELGQAESELDFFRVRALDSQIEIEWRR